MTTRDLISQVRSSLKLLSDDNVISDRYIASQLRTTASLLIKRETDRRKLWASSNIFTEISCLEMIPVSIAECCDYTSECTIMRSKKKIPKISEGIYGLLVQGVFSIDRKIRFKESSAVRYTNTLKLGLKQRPLYFWIQNDYLYISDPDIEKVNLVAYFEQDVPFDFSCENTNDCPDNPLDLPFKSPGYLEKPIVDMVLQTLSETYKKSKEDITSDGKDDSK